MDLLCGRGTAIAVSLAVREITNFSTSQRNSSRYSATPSDACLSNDLMESRFVSKCVSAGDFLALLAAFGEVGVAPGFLWPFHRRVKMGLLWSRESLCLNFS